MKNIICINLLKFDNNQLRIISDYMGNKYRYNSNVDSDDIYVSLIHHKKHNHYKVYFDVKSLESFAYTKKKTPDKVSLLDRTFINKKFIDNNITSIDFLKIKDFEIPLVEEVDIKGKSGVKQIEMTVDSILDKISKSGINSLSLNEKNFLDSLSK